jgi:hypothetical protein
MMKRVIVCILTSELEMVLNNKTILEFMVLIYNQNINMYTLWKILVKVEMFV